MKVKFLKFPSFVALLAGCALVSVAADGPPATATQSKPKVKPPAEHPFGLESAQREAKQLIVAEGLEATLFAAEPMLVNPCDMDIDERGRVWITEGANYRKWSNPPLRAEGDRIVILEDTDGDGRADKQTIFYQG